MILAPLFTLLPLLAVVASAQTPTYQWHTFYNPGADGWQGGTGRAAAADAAGNVYVAGETRFTANFAPGAPLHAVPAGARAAFIFKLNPTGQLVWYTFYSAYQGAGANAIALDGAGGLYIAGGGDLDGEGSQPPRNAGGAQALFVLKLNTDGQFQWHTKYGDGDSALALAVDAVNSRLYVTGEKHCCSGWSTPLPPIRPHTYGTNDIFVLALDLAGQHVWHTFHGPGAGLGRGIAVDGSGTVHVGGRQDGLITYFRVQPNGQLASYINYGRGEITGLAASQAGAVYATGATWPDWRGPAGQPPVHDYTVWAYGIFGLKLTAAGEYVSHTFFANNLHQQADGIATDSAGQVYITGNHPHYNANGPFDGPSLHDNQNQPGHFLAALDANLNYLWHTTYGAPWDTARAVAVDPNRNIFLAGGSGVAWLGDGSATPLSPQGGGDSVFAQKFALKSTPTLTWANPADIRHGTALGAAQLNASAPVAGTYNYAPAAGTVLSTGNNQTLSVVFTPTDTSSYNTAQAAVKINVLPALAPPAAARLVVSRTLARAAGQIVATIAVSNTGGAAAQNLVLSTGRINATSGTPLPRVLGLLPAGASVTTTLTFPGSAGAAGLPATFTAAGTYTGGSFNATSRVTLP